MYFNFIHNYIVCDSIIADNDDGWEDVDLLPSDKMDRLSECPNSEAVALIGTSHVHV